MSVRVYGEYSCDKTYTGIDKTSFHTSSGTLFVREDVLWDDSGCPRHVERNYVPLFGVYTIERRVT